MIKETAYNKVFAKCGVKTKLFYSVFLVAICFSYYFFL